MGRKLRSMARFQALEKPAAMGWPGLAIAVATDRGPLRVAAARGQEVREPTRSGGWSILCKLGGRVMSCRSLALLVALAGGTGVACGPGGSAPRFDRIDNQVA